MQVEHHRLAQEFPEYKQRIHELKLSSRRFAERFEQYNTVDDEICRIEEGIETPSDVYTENLKKQRVKLKDELFAMLQKG